MENFKTGILEPLGFSQKALKILSAVGDVELFSGGDIRQFISDKNAIFVRLSYQINDSLIGSSSFLKYICSPTTGLNHIEISKKGVQIVSLKGEYEFLSTIHATPEHIAGLTISLLRKYACAFIGKERNIWNRDLYKGFELYENTVGIIGMGRIGKIIAGYFHAFGAYVYYYDVINEINIENAVRLSSMEELISSTNIVILCANYRADNERLISDELLYLMKDKFFINAARGELVDEEALFEKIEKNWFKGVAIDVVSDETNAQKKMQKIVSQIENRNVIVTPHIGGATYASMSRTEEYIAGKLVDLITQNRQQEGYMR